MPFFVFFLPFFVFFSLYFDAHVRFSVFVVIAGCFFQLRTHLHMLITDWFFFQQEHLRIFTITSSTSLLHHHRFFFTFLNYSYCVGCVRLLERIVWERTVRHNASFSRWKSVRRRHVRIVTYRTLLYLRRMISFSYIQEMSYVIDRTRLIVVKYIICWSVLFPLTRCALNRCTACISHLSFRDILALLVWVSRCLVHATHSSYFNSVVLAKGSKKQLPCTNPFLLLILHHLIQYYPQRRAGERSEGGSDYVDLSSLLFERKQHTTHRYAYVRVCVYVFTYSCMCECMYEYMCMRLYVWCVCVCVFVCVYMCV